MYRGVLRQTGIEVERRRACHVQRSGHFGDEGPPLRTVFGSCVVSPTGRARESPPPQRKWGSSFEYTDHHRECSAVPILAYSKEVDRVLLWIVYIHNNRRSQRARYPSTINNEGYPILWEEVEAAVKSLKKVKSAGVDNIPSELVQAGGETMIDMLLIICNKIWQTGEWQAPWTQSLIITLPKKGNLQLCQNYRTNSLISHTSKVMLRILLNRLKPQAEEIIKEEQAGLRAGRSTNEQIFNLRIFCEKYLQHQQSLYHVFADFKKASTEFGMQLCGQPWGCITSMTTGSKP